MTVSPPNSDTNSTHESLNSLPNQGMDYPASEEVSPHERLGHRIDAFYRAHIRLELTSGPYAVRTAEREGDLRALFRLRHRCFQEKLGLPPNRLDIDDYDADADHLGVFDLETGEAVANYRLICSRYTKRFYTESEFQMQSVLSFPGTLLELGRACVAPEFRNGAILSMLWKGLCAYAREVDASLMFGCSSVHTMDPVVGARLYLGMAEQSWIDPELMAYPLAGYRIPGFERALEKAAHIQHDEPVGLPPLLKSYLRAGGKICGFPALDRDFQCMDFLTVIRPEKMEPAMRRRFGWC